MMADKEKHTYQSETLSALRHSLRSQGNASPAARAAPVWRQGAMQANGVQANSGGGAMAPRDGEASLGVPPLKMVLVHMQNDPRNAATKTTFHSIKTEEEIAEEDVAVRLIVRLIEHLKQAS